MKNKKRYRISMMTEEEDMGIFFVYIEAFSLEQKGHETIVADEVRVDLPGNIMEISEEPIK